MTLPSLTRTQLTAGSIALSLAALTPLVAFAAPWGGRWSNTERPVPTQACLQAVVAVQDAHARHAADMFQLRQDDMKAHRDALAAAALLPDEAARREALDTLHEEMRSKEKPELPEDVQLAMTAAEEACDGAFPLGHMMMGKGHGGPMGMMKMGRGRQGGERMGRMMHDQAPASLSDDDQEMSEEGEDRQSPPQSGWFNGRLGGR